MEKLGTLALSTDIFEKSNIGLWAFELDEGHEPRMYANAVMMKLIGLDHEVSPEETYHAWDFEKNGRMQHKQSCFTEAEAWMFSVLAPGTKKYTPGDINKRQLTIMGRIQNETNPLTVAFMLKFGFAPTQNAIGYKKGLYEHLPLCTESQFKIFGGFRAIPTQ